MTKLANRNIPPIVRPIRSINLTKVEKKQLGNGMQMLLQNIGTQELVKIELIFKAGIAYQKQKLVSSFTNKMMAEGTTSFSAYEIAKRFDSYGAYFNASTDKDFASLTLYCLTKHLDQVLPVFIEIVCEPVFPENELRTLTNKSQQEFAVNLQKVRSRAQLNFPSLIFGNEHPYGQKATLEDFEKITCEDLQSFYQNFYLNEDSSLIVSGKVDQQIINKLENSFGKLRLKTGPLNLTPDFKEIAVSGYSHHIKIKDTMQSAVWVGKKLFNKLNPDFIGMQVLNTVLGGYFGSRLMSNIREDKGYTYGINSSIVSHKEDGYFAIQTEVGSQHSQATLTEIFKEIDLLRSKKIDNSELELVKNYISGQLIRSLDGPFAVHDKLKAVILFGLDMNYYQSFIEEVLLITPETIRELANKHLQNNNLTQLIVGK